MTAILAYDLGASSGRALLGRLNGSRIEAEEIHRFPNDPVQVGDRLHWDVLRLYHEIKQGLVRAKLRGAEPQSIGIDSWAVDFGLIGRNGELLGNPYHYRDRHTDGVMEALFQQIPRETIFAKTGIQFLPFNTIYQLAAMKRSDSPLFAQAERFLMIPDLLRYFLTGEMMNEFTNATTTQLYNPKMDAWDRELLERIGVPVSWFGQPAEPGTAAGCLRSSVRAELGVGPIPVIAVAEHDTGSAVAAVPAADRSFAYLSCGTWSLMGTETQSPVINDLTLKYNFTNEGGFGRTYRLLKNIMGLWILQEAKREWELAGKRYTYAELAALAEQAPPFAAFIDPDDPLFLPAGPMAERIRQFCMRTGQKPPEETGPVVRCILESLAMKYKYVFELTERVAGQSFGGLHMVGGGIQNELLCQWTANALGLPVWAGPAEGSALGNLAVQWIARGMFANLREARQTIRESFPVSEYEPKLAEAWKEAYGSYIRITGLSE